MKMFESTLKNIQKKYKKGKLVFIKNTIKPKIIIETMLNIEKLLTMKEKLSHSIIKLYEEWRENFLR